MAQADATFVRGVAAGTNGIATVTNGGVVTIHYTGAGGQPHTFANTNLPAGQLVTNGATVFVGTNTPNLSTVVTNGQSGVTLSGTFAGDGSGLTNVAGGSFTTNTPVVPLQLTNYFYDVRAYGASPADGDDDTAAFQAVVALINATGGTMFIPRGRYNVSEQLTLTGAASPLDYGGTGGYQIVGEGASIVSWTGGAGGTNCLFYMNTPRNVLVRDIQVTTTTAITNFTAFAMKGPSGSNVKFDRVMIERAREAIIGDDMTDISLDVVTFNCNVGVATARSADRWRIRTRGQYGGPAVVLGYTNAIFPSVAPPGINFDNVTIDMVGDCSRAGDFGVPRAEIVVRGGGLATITAFTEANASGSPSSPFVIVTNHFGGTPVLNFVGTEILSKVNGHAHLWSPAVVRVLGNSSWDGKSSHFSVVFKTSAAQSGSAVQGDLLTSLWFMDNSKQYGPFTYNPGALYIDGGNVQDGLSVMNGILSSIRGATNVNGRIALDVGFTGTDANFVRTNATSGFRVVSTNGAAILAGYGQHRFVGDGSGLTNLNAAQLTLGTNVMRVPGASLYIANTNGADNVRLFAGSFQASGSGFVGNGIGLTNLNAAQLTSGTVPYARLTGVTITNLSIAGRMSIASLQPVTNWYGAQDISTPFFNNPGLSLMTPWGGNNYFNLVSESPYGASINFQSRTPPNGYRTNILTAYLLSTNSGTRVIGFNIGHWPASGTNGAALVNTYISGTLTNGANNVTNIVSLSLIHSTATPWSNSLPAQYRLMMQGAGTNWFVAVREVLLP